jgi:hypothetical protein
MNTTVPTSVPNVSATMKAYPLAECFFSCPTATKLLDSERFIKPLLIDSQNISGAKTRIIWKSDYTPISSKILIAEEDLVTSKSLRNLAFEIFNTQTTSTGLFQQARIGDVEMDSYARQIEEHERADTQEHFELIKQCGNHWTMSPEEQEKYTQDSFTVPETHFFIQEVSCHTDDYRQEWIRNFQKIYCEKHPADSRSCETNMTDLCNFDTVRNMPISERKEFIRERICKLFPQAHVTVKNDPVIRKPMQTKCPELLEKSSLQTIQVEL